MIRFVLAVVLLLVPAWGQVVPGQFILELTEEPAVRTREGRLAAVRSAQDRTRQSLSSRGVRIRQSIQRSANALVVEAGSEADLAGLPGVRKVHPVRLYKKLLDRSVLLQKITDAYALTGGMENAGRGIKIGIIDTGIDATHPGFQDPDLQQPDGFPKVSNNSDVGNTNNKVIVARNYDEDTESSARDRDGHGTGVAMIAAGGTVSGPYGVITGVAPKAWLGNYKVFPDDSDSAPSDAILRAIDDAIADGMDVINLSLGMFPAEAPAEDILVGAVDRATAAGVIVVVAAGNSGPTAATIGSPGTASSAITVGNAFNDRVFASTVQVEGANPFFAIPGSESGSSEPVTAVLRDVEEVDPTGLACSELPPGSMEGKIAFILRGVCFFEDKLNHAQKAGAVAAVVYTHSDSPEASIMGQGSARLPAVMLSNKDGLELKSRIFSLGTVEARVNFTSAAIMVDSSKLSASSSRGPSVDASIKPELLGVGTSVYTADQSTDTGAAFQVNSGTSFSAPMVAGAAAVLRFARPGLTAAQYRSLLINATSTFSYDHVVAAPVQQTGAGLLNLLAAVSSTITAYPQTVNLGSGTADLSKAASLTLTNIGTSDDTYSIVVNPLAAGLTPVVSETSLSVPAGHSREIQLRFEAGQLAPGAYQGFLTVRSSTSDSQAHIPYWYGVPSNDVETILVADPPESGPGSSVQELLIRPSDGSGFPVDTDVAVSVVEGGGSVVRVRRSTFFSGFWIAEVRLGSGTAMNVFEVIAGPKTTRVSIVGE